MTWDYDAFARAAGNHYGTTVTGSITSPSNIVLSTWAGVTYGPTHEPPGDGLAPVPARPTSPGPPPLPSRHAEVEP